MNYHKITPLDIANGPGVRVVLWVAGCEHHCPECHNQETWDPNSGKPFTQEALEELVEKINSKHVTGVTLSGGDPMAHCNRKAILDIIKEIRKMCPGKDIWIYSGYTYEALMQDNVAKEILSLCNVLVDGRFEKDKYSAMLKWRGSSNQRVIDLDQTKAAGTVQLYCD